MKQEEQYIGLIEKIADCLARDGRYQEADGLYSKLVKMKQCWGLNTLILWTAWRT
jgi:pentatricopeptide repeat protein